MPVKRGWRWTEDGVRWSKEWNAEDEESGESGIKRTSEVVKGMVNSANASLRCTVETGEDFEDGRLPTLDKNLWVEDGRLMHTFFEKKMASSKVIHKDSALGENCKMASLSQNLVRRLKNTCGRLPEWERTVVVDNFTTKLANSGYTRVQARRIVVSGIKGYEAIRRRAAEQGGKIHRSARSGAAARNRKKLTGKTSWYKEKDGDEDPVDEELKRSSILFTPPKPDSAAWQQQSEDEDQSRKKVEIRKKAPLTSILCLVQTSSG